MPYHSLWNIMEHNVPLRGLGVLLAFVLVSGSARAASEPAAALSAGTPQRRMVDELLASFRPYACCTETLGACLTRKPVCPLATRLERAIRRMAVAGFAKPAIEAVLAQRQATMMPEQRQASILFDDRFLAGNASVGVKLAVYACPRQQACAELIPDLYGEVTHGRLKDRAILLYRPFFAPGDEEATECGRGIYAAAHQGSFWPYLLHLCMERETLQRPTLRNWVGEHGLDRCIFNHTCEQTETAAWLETSRREGLANGVRRAPAVFINGRRVWGPLDLETLVDLVEEEHERMAAMPVKVQSGARARPTSGSSPKRK
jgi:hypothetical protein